MRKLFLKMLVEAIRKLKQQKRKDMVIWGSFSLAKQLIEANLIDEYHLQICPTAVGGGTLLFPSLSKYAEYNLVEIKKYDTGVVYLGYEPMR